MSRLRGRIASSGRRLRAVWARRLAPEAVDSSEHWVRIPLNEAIDRHIGRLGPERLSAVEISGSAHAGRPWRSHTSLSHPEFDLCAPLDAGAGRYDVVICEQVLEHVADPWGAAENLRGLCVPGGHVIVSTPFMVRVHELPLYGLRDYWRFTPRGLRVLLERAGLEVEAVGSWGNRSVIAGNLDGWPAYRRRRHSLADEEDLPVQVWAFARNPQSDR